MTALPPPSSSRSSVTAHAGVSDEPSPSPSAPEKSVQNLSEPPERGTAFWLVFLALCISLFVSALDVLIVATALPTILNDLQGTDFVWVANAYSLSSTAFMPWTGSMATIFGRKPIMLTALLIFLLGSGISAGAHSMAMLIAGRTVQGLGSGAILTMTEIIVSDLVPLRERGLFFGIIGSVWALASAVGPPLGGVFSEDVSWRWIFWINLPITGLAIILVFFFLQLKTPQEPFRQKIKRIDWIGNFLIIGGATASIIGLSWAGIRYSWGSAQTLVPLILGLATLVGAVIYEAKVPKEATIPFEILSNRTTIAGYTTTAIHAIVINALLFYLPVYFQSAKVATPIKSSVYTLASSFSIAPAAVLTGASVGIFHKYRPQNIFGWVLLTAGIGSWISFTSYSGAGSYVGLQILAGLGGGILFPATNFVVLAPLPLRLNAQALAFYTFIRQFFMTWGTTIGSTVLQNELKRRLPAAFVSQFPGGIELSYAAIPRIAGLETNLQAQVRDAFADSLRYVWIVIVSISAVGLFVSLFIKEIPLATVTDEAWGMKDGKKRGSVGSGDAETGDGAEVADRVVVGDQEKMAKK